MNPDLTEAQKELYQKAVEAYKMQDVEAMKLIYDQLFRPEDMSEVRFEIGCPVTVGRPSPMIRPSASRIFPR